MRSKKSFQGIEHENFTISSSRQRTQQRCQQNKLQKLCPYKSEDYRDRLGDTKGSMYIVDRGASLHMTVLSSLNHRRFFDSQQNMDIQSANGIVVSDTQANASIKELGARSWHVVTDSSSVLFSFVARMQHRNLPPNRRQYHPSNSRQPKETLSENKKWCTPVWTGYNHEQNDRRTRCILTPTARTDPAHEVVEEQSPDENFSRLPPMREEILWQKIPRVRKVSSSPTKRSPQCVNSIPVRPQ